MIKKILTLGVGFCGLLDMAMAAAFTLKIGGGWSWADGGDLNRNIAGWRRYYQAQQSPYFSASYTLKEMHSFPELGAEVVYCLSSRWSVGIQVGWQRQQKSGKILTQLNKDETRPLVPSGTTRLAVEEISSRHVSFTWESIPLVITFDRSLPLGEKFRLNFGLGGGMVWSKLRSGEDYRYSFNYIEEALAAGTSFQYVEKFVSGGGLKEETRSRGLCLFSRLGFHFKVSSSLSVAAELFGRWVELKHWEGERTESFEWQQVWGPWGAFSEKGKSKETQSGRLWRVDVRPDGAGGSYPRLVFSDKEPVSSAYLSVKPAVLNLSGAGLRIGLVFGFGQRN
ncbi:MAG: hypothetical protein ACUVV5_05615 [Candidatus Aminicenantales bacterium]